jgi:Rod binding domain-containing protein
MDDSLAVPQQTNVALQMIRANELSQKASSAEALKSAVESGGSDKLSDKQKADFAKVARGFESMFVHEMYKTMRQSMLDEDEKDGEEDMSFGGDVLQGMTDLQFSDSVSQSGKGMGIAQMMYKHLTGDSDLPAMLTQRSSRIPNDIGNQTKAGDIEKLDLSSINDNQDSIEKLRAIQARSLNSDSAPPTNQSFMERVNKRIASYSDTIESVADKHGVHPALVKAIITAESAGNPNAVSPVGAKGLMQLMDGTAKDLDVENSFDPIQNISGGTEYIARMLKKFGSLDHAIAAYNAGPGNVQKHGGIPPFAETQAYVQRVKRFMSHYAKTE